MKLSFEWDEAKAKENFKKHKVSFDEGKTIEDIRPEYDFSTMKGAVRGKYYKAYREGHKVEIHKEDGSTSIQYFKLEDGAVMLEPDVKKYFPSSKAVNKALRALIEIIPVKKRASNHRS